jgi:quinone-modifying oxidoreductase subunit QmoC
VSGEISVTTGDAAAEERTDTMTQGISQVAPAAVRDDKPLRVEPDLDFIRALSDRAGVSYKKCFQCGTCSGVCALSTNNDPLPRKEMAWAVWGLKDRLLTDPDVWLCHQCNDCSLRCPRGSRPGDVLSAVRHECVLHYSAPRFLARWVNEPQYLPLLLAIPAVLLSLMLTAKEWLEGALGITRNLGGRIVYPYTPELSHWMLNTIFFLFTFLALLGAIVGVRRFWRALRAADPRGNAVPPARGLGGSIWKVVTSVFTHDKFGECTHASGRYVSHLLVFFGFLALCLVTLWVITARYNPLVPDGFIYPLSFWSPWKILANLGGAAILVGGVWMAVDRLRENDRTSAGTYFDWSLLSILLLVVVTGFITEVLHYIRLEPHRHAVYFVHLVLIFHLLVYLPYSKLAHVLSEYAGIHQASPEPSSGENR